MWLGLAIAVAAAVVGWTVRGRLAEESEDFALQAVEKWRKERDVAKLRVKQLAVRLRAAERQLIALAPGRAANSLRGETNGLTVLKADFVANLLADQVEERVDAEVVEVREADVVKIAPRIHRDRLSGQAFTSGQPNGIPALPAKAAGNGASLWTDEPRRSHASKSPSSSGHSLNDLGEIPLGALKQLRAWGVHNTSDLRDYFHTCTEPQELASTLGVEFRKVRRWRVLVDFLEIPGLGPKDAWLLEISGVGSLGELAKQDPKELLAWMAGLNEDQGLTLPIPEPEAVTRWVQWASQKVEGRRRPSGQDQMNGAPRERGFTRTQVRSLQGSR